MSIIETYLYMLFADNDNHLVPFLFKDIDYNVSENAVRTLAQAIIDNGSIFTYTPTTMNKAKLTQLNTKDVNI